MRTVRVRWLALWLALLLTGPTAYAWGPRGHELINQHAIATLPPELRPFFQAHRDWLIANAGAPDQWKDTDPGEPPHHFIDMERYARKFERMPTTREEAVAGTSADFVKDSGDLIWWLPHATHKLGEAMRDGKQEEILHWAVAVAHYAADVCQPLHTTENYDGQLSGQIGVHSRFETLTVDRLAGSLELKPPPARVHPNTFDAVFSRIARTYRRLDEVLAADAQAAGLDPNFGPTYTLRMAARLRGLIREQLECGATLTGSLWLTAWVEAGKPELAAVVAAER